MAELRTIDLPDEAATHAAGRALAPVVHTGDLITLEGPLGAGKTSFARGLLAGLGLVGEAPSPTFAVVLRYDPPEVRLPVSHADLYRIDDPAEIEELGLDEAQEDGALILEWPERLGYPLPAEHLRIALAPLATGGRRLTCHLGPAWQVRWPLP